MRLIFAFYNLLRIAFFFTFIFSFSIVSPNHDSHYRQVRQRAHALSLSLSVWQNFILFVNVISRQFLMCSLGFRILFHSCVCKKFYRKTNSSISNSRNHPCSHVRSPRHAKWNIKERRREREFLPKRKQNHCTMDWTSKQKKAMNRNSFHLTL